MKSNRREFIKKSGCALGMTALATQFNTFGLINAFAQKSIDDKQPEGGEDYKALVLVYMSGGNDGNNTLIPNHSDATMSNYAAYNSVRSGQGLAIPQAQLLPISVPRMGGLTYGLHPSFGPLATGGINNGMHELWAQGKMAIVPNCGTLVQPLLDRSEYQNSQFRKPYQLFSHSDQVEQSQTSYAGFQSFTGWGGRLADKMNGISNPAGVLPMITSIAGAQLFTSGQGTSALAIANAGTALTDVLRPRGFTGTGSTERKTAFNQLRTYDLNQNYVKAASDITNVAIAANDQFASSQEVQQPFPTSSIGLQLKQVARLIKMRLSLNINRQVFYVQLGSFDTHTNQLATQSTLLAQFSQAVRSFYEEMVSQGVSNNVTLFTLSDFGRTFVPAGSGGSVGSDHAWGNHLFVVGGAVAGADFYGMNTSNGTPFPTLNVGAAGPDDTDSNSGARGRWIPKTSVDQYAATLATWFGLPAEFQSDVFPNIGNFPVKNLNFLI